jgi:hypothetical protein
VEDLAAEIAESAEMYSNSMHVSAFFAVSAASLPSDMNKTIHVYNVARARQIALDNPTIETRE